MKKNIDIGEFVKKAFEKNTQPQQPNKMVLERIHKTLDKPKLGVNNTLFWMTFSVLIIGPAFYLFLDTGTANLQDENNIVNTTLMEQSNELSEGEIIGPILFSDLQSTNKDILTQENASVYYSLIIDTTQQNLINTTPIKTKTNIANTNYDIDKLFKQKTIYHYYRSSDSLKIETTDKRVIDSILSAKNNKQPIDSLQ